MRTAKRSKHWIFLLTVVSVLGVFGMVCGAGASNNFPGIYQSYFGTTPSCTLCHSGGSALNSTGTIFFNAGGNTLAGWAAIKPADPKPPTVAITTPTSSPTYTASSSSLSIGGTASDNFTGPFGVTQVTWSNSLGGAGTCSGTTSWSASGIALSSGQNVITVTARDEAGNTGTGTLTVTYTPVPVLTTINVTPPSVSITQGSTQPFSAQALDQNNNPMSATFTWSSSDATIATINSSSGLATGVAAGGPVTIRAASGTVSGTASLTVTMAPAQETTDLSIWVGKWFKVKIQNRGYYNEKENRLSNDRQSLSAYLKITAWDPDNKVLRATILGKGEDGEGKWSEPISLHYISGTNLNFLCWSQLTLASNANYGFTARIRGIMRRGDSVRGIFTSVGGYHVETTEDDEDEDEDDDGEELSSKQPSAGWLKITGKLIAEERVPADIKE